MFSQGGFNLFLVLFVECFCVCLTVDGTTRLKQYLFSNLTYDSSVRPFHNDTEAVLVKLGLALRQVIDLDERNQILFVSLWNRWNWYDPRLTWDPKDFDGVKVFHSRPDNVWRPDIVLYNDVRIEVRDVSQYEVFIHNDGLMMWNFPTLMKSACQLNVQYFPYDQQICPLKYGSWAYHIDQIDVTNRSNAGDTGSFTENGEFKLVDIPVRRHVVKYGCCPEGYPDLTFFIILKRKTLFITYTLLLPSISVAILTIIGFYLPPDSGEKIILGITTLLALFVFLLLVADAMPPNSEVFPLIGQFFMATIFLITASVIATILILNIYFHGKLGHKFPKGPKRFIFGCLAKTLLMNHHVESLNKEQEVLKRCHEQHKRMSLRSLISKVVVANKPSSSLKYLTSDDSSDEDVPGIHPKSSVEHFHMVAKRELRITRRMTKEIGSKIEVFEKLQLAKENTHLAESEWRIAALILDKLLMVVFLIATAVIIYSYLSVMPDYTINDTVLHKHRN